MSMFWAGLALLFVQYRLINTVVEKRVRIKENFNDQIDILESIAVVLLNEIKLLTNQRSQSK